MNKISTASIVVLLLMVVNVFGADSKKAATLPKDLKEYQARIEKLSKWDLLGEHGSLNDRICCKQLLYLLRCCYKPYEDDFKKNEYKRWMVRQELYRRDEYWENRC